jgi:hypothetical protein
MRGYSECVRAIESNWGMRSLSIVHDSLKNSKFMFPNSIFFVLYYLSFLFAWIVIWAINLVMIMSATVDENLPSGRPTPAVKRTETATARFPRAHLKRRYAYQSCD